MEVQVSPKNFPSKSVSEEFGSDAKSCCKSNAYQAWLQEDRVCKFSDGSISEIHLTCPSHCTRQFSIQYDEDITPFDGEFNTFDFTFLADKALRVSKFVNVNHI